MDAVVDRFGRIDVLVANAGVGSYGPFTELSDEALAALVQTNVLGVMHTVRAALAAMDGRGRIVLVGSIAGRVGVPLEAAYSATKHAVDGLGRALAAELAPRGIAVTVVNLGPLDTGFAETAGHTYGRRRPRPMPVERAAAGVLRAADRGAVEAIVPRWLRISVITDALVPRLYVRGAERACAGELRGFHAMGRGNESAAGVMTRLSEREPSRPHGPRRPGELPCRTALPAGGGPGRPDGALRLRPPGRLARRRVRGRPHRDARLGRHLDRSGRRGRRRRRAGVRPGRGHDPPPSTCPCSRSTTSSRPTGATRSSTATRRSTTSSTTAGCRPTPSAAWCSVCSARRRPRPPRGPTTCAPPCRSSSTARTSARTPAPGASTCRPTSWRPTA